MHNCVLYDMLGWRSGVSRVWPPVHLIGSSNPVPFRCHSNQLSLRSESLLLITVQLHGLFRNTKKISNMSNNSKPLYVTNPEEWLKETVQGSDLLAIVIFRGSWCKYDRHYLRKLGQHHLSTMKKENVKLIAWTSEGAEGAQKADQEWGLTKDYGYEMVIGDETNALANYFKDDMILEDLLIVSPQEAHVEKLVTPGTYPNGLVQPGVVVYAHHGIPAFQWAAKCEEPGYGGPNRPDPTDLWQHLLKRKHALDHGNAVMPIHGKDLKMCTTDWEIFFANCSIL